MQFGPHLYPFLYVIRASEMKFLKVKKKKKKLKKETPPQCAAAATAVGIRRVCDRCGNAEV